MDQLKEILKQAIRFRFWIAVGLSAVLPMIAYVAGAGPIKEKAITEQAAIEGANTGVKAFTSGAVINAQYKQLVSEKTEELTKDVDESWKKLYDRQAPLLTWPERVHDRFKTWGRQWPKEVDPSAVQIAIIDYVNAYPGFVTEVYKSFQPFDYVEGTGLVAAPPEEALLRPAKFTEEAPPGLGKVWAAQERLWIQRTMLDVVAKVNKDAKTWDTAVIKQINALEVGNPLAQDQRSIAGGEVLDPAPDIADPAAAVAVASAPATPVVGAATAPVPGAAPTDPAGVYYIHTDSTAFKVLPVQMTVLIEQDHIQDFLVALENSPMTIQVRDFEMAKPATRVAKPQKGAAMYGMMGSGGYMGSEMMMPGMGNMTGFGARMTEMAPMGMAGYGAGQGAAAAQRKGVDSRSKNRAKEQAEALEKAKAVVGASLHDPYYNIVEVKVYGQARFFNPPTAAEPSQAATTAATPAEAATATPAPAAAATATPAPAEAEKKAEAGAEKKETAAPEKKADEPKPAPEKKAEPEKKADEPKAKAPAPK